MPTQQWGFINHEGEWVIAPQYEHAMPHMCGRAAVKKDGLYGYIDLLGNMVIQPQFKDFGLFRSERCLVKVDGRKICIDPNGTKVFDLFYDSALDYSEGLARARDPHSMASGYGYLDVQGNVALPFKYFLAEAFHEGLASIADGGESFWFIDKKGQLICGPFLDATSYSEGVAVVQDNRWRFINRTGSVLFTLPSGVRTIGSFHAGMCTIKDNSNQGLYGFIDRSFDMAIPCRYEDAWGFSEGVATVCMGDKWRMVDSSGRELCKPLYSLIDSCSEGLCAARRDGLYGFLDRTGIEVISPKFPLAHGFSAGLAAVAIEH